MRIWNYVLEEFIDPLAVDYLRSRVNGSEHMQLYVEEGRFGLDQYRSPIEQHTIVSEGEKIFGDLWEGIRGERDKEDYALVIDIVTQDYRFAQNVAKAEKLIPKMENPNLCYIRPLL